jgi:hypothetical protein
MRIHLIEIAEPPVTMIKALDTMSWVISRTRADGNQLKMRANIAAANGTIVSEKRCGVHTSKGIHWNTTA